MPNFVYWEAKWLPPPKRGAPAKVARVPAEVALSVIVKGLDGYSKAVQDEARAVMLTAAGKIQTEAVREAPDYLGSLRKSIRIEGDGPNAVRVKAGGPGAQYAAFLEFGTRSGRPSVETIEKWMRRKGIRPIIKSTHKGRPYYDAAVAIQKKIMRRGIPGKPFLFPAFERHRQEFVDGMRRAFKGG